MIKQKKIETMEKFKKNFLPELQEKEIISKEKSQDDHGYKIALSVLKGIKADLSKLKQE